MADIEQRIINTQLNGKIEIVDAKFNQFMEEMRARDDKRSAEISEIRASIDSMGKHVRNVSIAAFVGIGAMVVTSVIGIAAMVWSVIPK